MRSNRSANTQVFDRFSGVGSMNCSLDPIETRKQTPAKRTSSTAARRTPTNGTTTSTSNTPSNKPNFRVTPTKASSSRDGFGMPPSVNNGSSPSSSRRTPNRSTTPSNRTRSFPSPPVGYSAQQPQRRPVSSPGASQTPTNRPPRRSATPVVATPKNLPSNLEGISKVLHHKLNSITTVREQIEALTVKHRAEEEELVNAVNSMLTHETEAATDQKTQAELVSIVEERNKAIAMLDVFRREGNEIITKLHQNLQTSQVENEKHLETISKLTAENDRLKLLLGGSAENGSEGAVDQQQTIHEMNEMMTELDAMVINLKAQNEALASKNQSLHDRLSLLESADFHSDVETGDPDTLKAALRSEKRARLEAEEISHRLLMEHQKNVSLLEQRLSRNTPRSGASGIVSPRARDRSAADDPSTPTGPKSMTPRSDNQPPSTNSNEDEAEREVAVSAPVATESATEASAALEPETVEATEEVQPEEVVDKEAGVSPKEAEPATEEETHAEPTVEETQEEEQIAVEDAGDAASPEPVDDQEDNLRQLQDIERQLMEVAAALDD